MSEVTRILSAIEEGDTHAAERLLPLKNAAARPSDSPSTLPKRPLPRATNNSFDNDALNDFARADPQAAALVKLRFFAGMTMTEAADALSMSVRSAHDLFNTPATSVPPTKARHRRPSEKRPRG